jgi:hypothetical protein
MTVVQFTEDEVPRVRNRDAKGVQEHCTTEIGCRRLKAEGTRMNLFKKNRAFFTTLARKIC